MIWKRFFELNIVLLSISLFFTSCETDENSLPFNIPSNEAEIVDVEFSINSTNSSFYYLILAKQLMINWGDESRINEYIELNDNPNWSLIHPIEHKYAENGVYNVNIRTSKPYCFDFSKRDTLSDETSIRKITLTTCRTLSQFLCRNQPITSLNLADCYNLTVLDIGSSAVENLTIRKENRLKKLVIDSTAIAVFDMQITPFVEYLSVGGGADLNQEIINIDTLKYLKRIDLKGNLSENNLSFQANDSLMQVRASNSNIESINLSLQTKLDTLSILNCDKLTKIDLGINNLNLRRVVLVNNNALSALAINNIFRSLPSAGSTSRTIRLEGNAGDDRCDKQIAVDKGWVFE